MKGKKSFFDRLVLSLNNHGLLNWMSDEANIRLVYKAQIGEKLNLKNPTRFNEKMQWMKLYDRDPRYCRLADKWDVRAYVKETVGEEYLIPAYGVWDRFSDIDFSVLPDRFVVKCTHDSGSVWICGDKSKADLEYENRYFTKRLKRGGFYYGREWPYKDLKPRLIAEKHMIDRETGDLRDYKIHCFGGKARCILVCSDRHTSGLKEDWYTPEWEHLPIRRPTHRNTDNGIPKPEKLEQMIRLAEKLAAGLRFARVDFYLVDGRIYFGEITFFPTSGYTRFVPDEYDRILGDWITLSE